MGGWKGWGVEVRGGALGGIAPTNLCRLCLTFFNLFIAIY